MPYSAADLEKLTRDEVIAIARQEGLLVCNTKQAAIKAIEQQQRDIERAKNRMTDIRAGKGHSTA